MALTDVEVKRVKGREKPYNLSDAGWLYLRVTPSGGKHWQWSYRMDGKQKTMRMGRYLEVTLAEARAKHWVARKLRVSGVDPIE